MVRRRTKQSFTVAHPHIAAIAIFIVVATVGSGIVLTTGAYVTSAPTQHPVDIAAVDASFPEKVNQVSYVGSVTLANYGSVSATSVQYKILVTDAVSGGMVWQYANRETLLAGDMRTFELPHFDVRAGTYRVTVLADSAYDFNEADELNNSFEDIFTVTE